jgi:hypothetical protein
MGWGVFIESEHVRHVVPLDDPPGHIQTTHEEDYPFGPFPECDCRCKPRWEREGDVIIFIHSSFDGREALEWAMDILGEK